MLVIVERFMLQCTDTCMFPHRSPCYKGMWTSPGPSGIQLYVAVTSVWEEGTVEGKKSALFPPGSRAYMLLVSVQQRVL